MCRRGIHPNWHSAETEALCWMLDLDYPKGWEWVSSKRELKGDGTVVGHVLIRDKATGAYQTVDYYSGLKRK